MLKLSLFHRIFIYFIIVILISLVTTATITYWQSAKEFDEYMYDRMKQTLNNAVHHTNMYFKAYETTLTLLSSEQVHKFVSLPGNDYFGHYDYGSPIKEIHFQNAILRNPEIASLYLISRNGQYVTIFNNLKGLGLEVYDRSFERKKVYEVLDNATDRRGSIQVFENSVISPENDKLMTLSKRISSPSNVNDFIGVIGIEVHKNELERLWEGIDLGEQGYFFVVSDSGQIIYHPSHEMINTHLDVELASKISERAGEAIYDHSGEEKTVYLSRPSNYADWNLVVSMPLHDLRKPINNIRTNTFIMSVITLIIALILAFRFGQLIIGPIRTLKKGMVETEQGKWVHLPLTGRQDEMDDLTKRYNKMVTRLSQLVDRVYKAELKEREIQVERNKAELQALQLQVNPHFLYNTLETIACYAVINDSEEITDIVKYLSQMLRYAVRTDLEAVTVENEINHVDCYMKILNHRTGMDFEIDIDILPEHMSRNIVRLTLQPIIENIFKHAFPDGIEEHHFIRITSFVKDDEFIICVEDNGIGISEEVLKNLKQVLNGNQTGYSTSQGGGGIGLANVHRRIQMVFGEEYGLTIESESYKGTKMYLRMPINQTKTESAIA
ncbi:sensor histidine kinase [Bacillus nitroreducens]